jgi:hypothetical protein
METKLKFQKSSFADVYGTSYSPTNYTGNKYTQTVTPTANDVYIYDCVFSFCSSSSNGGALSCGSSVYRLLIEQSSFISCRISSGYGGAIYFDSRTYGECVLNRVCGFNCSSTSSGYTQGAYSNIFVKDNIANKNHVNDSSITHCMPECTNSHVTLIIHYGKVLSPSVNLTNNVCYCYSAVYYCGVTGTDTCYVSYNSIVNNTANSYNCIWFHNSGSSNCMDSCNILNNKQDLSTYGIILTYGDLIIKDSCILGNDEKNNVFFECTSSKKITISNCTIDGNIFASGRYSGSVTIIKTNEKPFINALSHIVTQRCDSYFDSYGTLTLKPNIPSKSPRCIISCNCNHLTIDPVRSVHFIFLLTFLPSNSA